MPMRTGMEQLIAQRTTDIFAKASEQDGEVTRLTRNAITVTYEDGSMVSVALGIRHGNAAGVIYPHDVVTDLKKGDKVKAGDILAYNRKFFAPDTYNPGQVALKMGAMLRTALIDDIDTLEDGSAISERVAKLMNTQVTKCRTIEVRFDQTIHELVKVGDEVDLETILCTIEDPETANNPLFDAASTEILRRLSASTPRAKAVGQVSRIEVFYHGDFEDLSDNLKTLATAGDRERRKRAKDMNQTPFTGQVDTSFRVKGKALDLDTMAIQVYIDYQVGAGVGDKLVFANQMKSVISHVMTGENYTERGERLDGKFANTSIEDRMVHSPKQIGTTNTLSRVLSKHIVGVYRGTKDARRQS